MSKPSATDPAHPACSKVHCSTSAGVVGPSVGPRIRHEQRTIDAMLDIYCQDHHQLNGRPNHRPGTHRCAEYEQLRAYAHQRLASCPFQEEKPVCNRCEVHCYSAVKREQVRAVMRYAGPRMPLRHPWLALRHLLDKLRRIPSLQSFRARAKTRRRTCLASQHIQPPQDTQANRTHSANQAHQANHNNQGNPNTLANRPQGAIQTSPANQEDHRP